MIPQFQWLKYLIYLELSVAQPVDFTTENAYVMHSKSNLSFCNRVCADGAVSDQCIQTVLAYLGRTPFRWFVDARDTEQIQKLEEHNFTNICAYPALSADLNTMQFTLPNADIVVKEITTEEEIDTWIAIGAACYQVDEQEYAKFIHYILKRSDPGLTHLYTAFYHNKPVAVGMFVLRGAITSVHLVGTLFQYRGKGIGHAITNVPLQDMHHQGAQTAILLASSMGTSLYKKMGFVEYGLCKVYEPQKN